jgi:hypothetical protein
VSAVRIAAATVAVAACGIGAAHAQVVPGRVQGEYAIGSCEAPEVSVIIDGAGMTVVDAGGRTLTSVVAETAQDAGDQIDMRVVVEGAPGTMSLVDLGGGAINVLYRPDGGTPEAPQRLELCAAAVTDTGEDVGAIPPLTHDRVPPILLGEFASGSCAAPQERLVIEETRLESFTGNVSNGVAQVLEVWQIADGYALYIDFAGTQGTLELSIINQDIVEGVFTPATGGTPAPETLYRCTPVVTDGTTSVIDHTTTDDVPVTTTAAIPAEYLGRYALGDSCEDATTLIEFQPGQLVVTDNGAPGPVIEVRAVTATSPNLEFTAVSDGRVGDVVMEPAGGSRYTITFTAQGSATSDRPETLTRCDAPIDDTVDNTVDDTVVPVGTSSIGSFLFDEPAARFGALMAELESVCQPGSEQRCIDTLWAFADVTGDGLLTGPEMARVVRYALKWGMSQNQPQLRPGQQIAVHLGSMVTAPLVANGLIYNHDYDGNNALSQVELFPDGVASAPIAVPALMELLSESTLEDVVESLEELQRM